jgi:chaperonin GroES
VLTTGILLHCLQVDAGVTGQEENNIGPEGRNFLNFERRTTMNIRPLQDRIIVERYEEETTTAGGIIIPDTVSKEKPQEGKVIAVGKGKVTAEGKVLALDVKVDDIVLFGKYAGSEIKVDGKEYMIMREDDILGVISK